MNEKALRWIINIAGIVCLYAFLAIRFQPLFNLVVQEKILPEYWENTKYGELYYFSFIKNFREKNLPKYREKYRHTPKHPKLQDADILTYGDSFFDFSRLVTFPERLGDSLHQKVHYERFFDDHRPLVNLLENDYKNTQPKILIYESAERYIPHRFMKKHEMEVRNDKRSKIRKAVANFRDLLFLELTEAKYTTLINRSYFTTYIYSLIATIKFNVFSYITSLTPKYCFTKDSPWLFYYEQTNDNPTSFYYKHTQEEIDNYCNNIADLSHKLKKYYNLDMIFMPIPSKYTIYHKLLNNDNYNNFLPMLYDGLEKRGVPVVKLYEDYDKADDILYFGTDTHWNEKGLQIALNKAVDVINDMNNNKLLFANDTSIKRIKEKKFINKK